MQGTNPKYSSYFISPKRSRHIQPLCYLLLADNKRRELILAQKLGSMLIPVIDFLIYTLMIITSQNVHNVNLSEYPHLVIRIVGISNRKATSNGTNCSGYNINKALYDGMTVQAYQEMIARRFNPADPQFSLTKHLRYDIKNGFLELHPSR